jgi:glycosyltransferase involved in cell wall biosynthesis
VKLLFVIKSLSLQGGGAERVLAEVTGGLAARGHDVTVASFDSPDSADFYPFAPEIRRVRFGIGSSDQRSGAGETLRRIRALRRLARAEAPDAAIGFMHSAYIPLGLALAGTGIPAIAGEHIVYGHYQDRRVERTLLGIVPSFVHSVTAISEEMRRGFPARIRQKMVIVPNPVAAAGGARADVIGGAEKVVLTVGRLEEQKDQRTLVAAFAQVAGRFPEWRVRIVGEGILRPALEAQVEALGLGDRIALPGATADVSCEYSRAQLFAMPSTYESFGLATAEAMAHGVPAVGFADCPGTNELIVDGENGLLVCGEDRPAALAAGLARLMGSAEERVRMGAAAPARIAPFAPERVVDRWEALLSAAAQGRPAPL